MSLTYKSVLWLPDSASLFPPVSALWTQDRPLTPPAPLLSASPGIVSTDIGVLLYYQTFQSMIRDCNSKAACSEAKAAVIFSHPRNCHWHSTSHPIKWACINLYSPDCLLLTIWDPKESAAQNWITNTIYNLLNTTCNFSNFISNFSNTTCTLSTTICNFSRTISNFYNTISNYLF